MRERPMLGKVYLTILAVLAAAFIITYVLHFAPISHWHLAPDQEIWAQFGEYIGGVFGTLAFAGVLITLQMQLEQLKKLEAQSSIDELHRLCRVLSAIVDRQLDDRCLVADSPRVDQLVDQQDVTVRRYLKDIAPLYGTPNHPPQNSEMEERIRAVAQDLQQLEDCVTESVARGGSKTIAGFYRARYQEIARRLCSINMFSKWGFLMANEERY
jgi:hypothetical protein